jgi:plastocyanin
VSITPGMKLGSLLLVVSFAVFALAFYGGAKLVEEERVAALNGGPDGEVPAGPVTIEIVGRNLLFDKRVITASAGNLVTIIFDNRDPGVLHNVAFYTNARATTPIFIGELFPGPRVVEESFTAPSSPGNYFFRCDVHPDTMTGTFAVR